LYIVFTVNNSFSIHYLKGFNMSNTNATITPLTDPQKAIRTRVMGIVTKRNGKNRGFVLGAQYNTSWQKVVASLRASGTLVTRKGHAGLWAKDFDPSKLVVIAKKATPRKAAAKDTPRKSAPRPRKASKPAVTAPAVEAPVVPAPATEAPTA
jgi:hypothetical protein